MSSAADAAMVEVIAWWSRLQEPMHPVVFRVALRVNIWEGGVVRNEAILPDGTRDILGLWIEGTEGARF